MGEVRRRTCCRTAIDLRQMTSARRAVTGVAGERRQINGSPPKKRDSRAHGFDAHRRDSRRSATPPPHSHSAEMRRSRRCSRAVLTAHRAATFRSRSPAGAARPPRGPGSARPISASSRRAGSTLATRVGGTPLSRKPRSPASCSAYSRSERAREFLRASCRVRRLVRRSSPRSRAARDRAALRDAPASPARRYSQRVAAAMPVRADLRHRHSCQIGATEFAQPATAASRRCGRRARRSAAANRGSAGRRVAATAAHVRLLRKVEVGEDQREAAHGGIVSDP